MSGFKDKALNSRIANNILKDIISKVLFCSKLMVEDCKKEKKKIRNHEEDIRDYLFHNYLEDYDIRDKVGLHQVRFIPEAQEHYVNSKPIGRVDLKVMSSEMFSFPKEYFIIECKRLDGSKTLNRFYLKEGVERFVGGENPIYTSYFKRNCMFGFVVQEIDIRTVPLTLLVILLFNCTTYSMISPRSSANPALVRNSPLNV